MLRGIRLASVWIHRDCRLRLSRTETDLRREGEFGRILLTDMETESVLDFM